MQMMVLILFALFTNVFSKLFDDEIEAICEITKYENFNNFLCSNPCPYNGVVCLNNETITQLNLTGLLRPNSKLGQLSTKIGYLSNLAFLVLNSRLNGTIPTQIGLTKLTYLELSNNENLSGTIPTQLGNMTSLLNLNLSNNSLSGSIPNQFINLSLDSLDLSHNQLYGEISRALFFDYAIISTIDLSHNKFNGTVPHWIRLNVTKMDLSNNQLTGTIPFTLGTFPIGHLDLSWNQLDGFIPTFGTPNNLTYLNLEGNQLNITIIPAGILDNMDLTLLIGKQTLKLDEGNVFTQTVTIDRDTTLLSINVNLTTNSLILSENSALLLSNSTIFVQDNITIPTGFILNITDPTSISLQTPNCIEIKGNTTLNINIVNPNLLQTNQTLVSFKCRSGSFTKITINDQCKEVNEYQFSIVLAQKQSCQTSSAPNCAFNFGFLLLVFFYLVVSH